jgi:hypothetical protein
MIQHGKAGLLVRASILPFAFTEARFEPGYRRTLLVMSGCLLKSAVHPLNTFRSNLRLVGFSFISSADTEEKKGLRASSASSDSKDKKHPLRYLMVPFSEKDEAKRLGARWDAEKKLWYDPSQNAKLDKWFRSADQKASNYIAVPLKESNSARKYLGVPYHENEEAKSLGAKWDHRARLWYDPSSDSSALDRWKMNTTAIIELKGEDRTFGGSLLFVDLIPRSCWFTNVRYCVHPSDWERLRRHVYARAGSRCECCGAHTPRPEAHERWSYDAVRRVQTLARLVALCCSCHEATHMGLAELRGRGDDATAHLRRVRGFTDQEAEAHIRDAFRLWSERSSIEWELDLSIITDSGIRLAREVDAGGRHQVALAALAREAEPLGRAAPRRFPSSKRGAAADDSAEGLSGDGGAAR